jgi:type IV secretory pathway VirB2 component (pilin)
MFSCLTAGLRGCALRLDRWFRAALYLVVSALFLSGALWLLTDRLKQLSNGEPWSRMSASLLMLHGAGAMVMLVLVGALMPFHVRVGWRRNRNRMTGVVMLAANAALIVTAFGLYYAGAEPVRNWASAVHTGVGLALPALLAVHIVRGRRRPHAVAVARPSSVDRRSTAPPRELSRP